MTKRAAELELATIIQAAIKRPWISGRMPSRSTFCVRLERVDGEHIVRALRRKRKTK
jgi:hypothetical protein